MHDWFFSHEPNELINLYKQLQLLITIKLLNDLMEFENWNEWSICFPHLNKKIGREKRKDVFCCHFTNNFFLFIAFS